MLIVGHRGAAALGPENTLRALTEGMKCADYVEIDLRLSRDGIPVVIHDATLERTTNGRGGVQDRTAAELQELDAGGGERIPTLAEAIELVRGRCGLVVELKETRGIEMICTVLRESGMERIGIVSFHTESLRKARTLLPVPTGLIFSRESGTALQAAEEDAIDWILPKYPLLTRTLVEMAHERGRKVIAWTLNAAPAIRRARDLGVDGIASDDPCTARRYVRDALPGGSGGNRA
ncbi:MAG: glycerophosphodiester phosphodiesterase [Methanomicrobiales archaeon]|nr:glycerophosphodiester phosphodiesterase [Methanomicrobiales archaeon]MDI6877490.1 glycerophosphodiester phosphodiesterase [Methanomicrobiales archaeon]